MLNVEDFTSTPKGTNEEMSHNHVLNSLHVVLYRVLVIEIDCILGRVLIIICKIIIESYTLVIWT